MTKQPNTPALVAAYSVAPTRLIPLCQFEALSPKNKFLGKTPNERGWTKKEYDFVSMVDHMAGGSNVGFRLGGEYAVIDWDCRRDPAVLTLTSAGVSLVDAVRQCEAAGTRSVDKLCARIGVDMAKCFVVRTGGYGVHIYLRLAKPWHGREQIPEFPGCEWKHSPRRYVVALGSLHPGDAELGIEPGRPYTLREGSVALNHTMIAPQALLTLYEHLTPPPNECGQGPESFGNFTPEQLGDTLTHIPPQTFGADAIPSWEQFMMACHWMTGGEGREEFVAWSISDPTYADHEEIIRKRWDSCTPRADSIKTGLIFKTLERLNVDREHWPTEGAGVLFADVEMTAEEIEGIGVVASDPLPPGVQQLGKATSFSFDALSSKLGDLPPFLDGFFYGNAGGIYVVYGAPKSGKSLLVYSLCLAVAGGDRQWMGQRLWLHGPVRWFALESSHSLVMSGKAWMKRTKRAHPDIRFTFNGQGFTDPKWMDEMEALCRGCKLAVVDTFTMAIPGLDQNSPEASSVLFAKLNEIGQRTGTTFIVIHHSTKADPRNARGSNAITGNSDGSVAVIKEGDGEIKVEAQDVRYGPDDSVFEVAIEQEIIGTDPRRDSQTITGPFLTMIDRGEEDGPASPLDDVASFVVTHGKQHGDAFALSRKIVRAHDLEPRSIRAIFERWEQTFTGQGYTLDLERVEGSKAQAIVVRCGAGSPLRGQRASAMFSDSLLSAEEVSGHSGLF